MKRTLLALFAASAFVLPACGGSSDSDGGQDGGPQDAGHGEYALSRVTQLPAGDAHCALGGTLTERGNDLNGDGVLDDGEVLDASYDCCTLPADAKEQACEGLSCGKGSMADSCGTVHEYECGACQGGTECQGGECICSADIALAREACGNDLCGDVTIQSACDGGAPKEVSCGACGADENCLTDAATGAKDCCLPLSPSAAKAAYCNVPPHYWNCGGPIQVDDGCGGKVEVDCGPADGCADGTVCNDDPESYSFFQCVKKNCTPKKETAEEFCTRHGIRCGALESTDTCGAMRSVEDCGVCGQPKSCDYATGQCSCTPISCEEQGLTCGEAYDGCGHFIQCGDACAEDDASLSVRIRLLAGNLSTTKDGVCKQCYDGGEGIRILQGLKPQVAMLQEFRYGDSSYSSIRRMVQKAFGDRFYHQVQAMGGGIRIPNGVVSYYPIKDWGTIDETTLTDRDHVWARLDIPGPHDLWVVSVHIPTNGTDRQTSIPELREGLARLNIPADDYVAIGGDFNTSSRGNDQGLRMLDDTGLVVLDTDRDCPIDQQGGDNTNITRTKDYDAIYTSQNLKDLRIPVVIGTAKDLTERGLVFDSHLFTPLSEVAPVQKDDSYGPDMQHMAVIKDYGVKR